MTTGDCSGFSVISMNQSSTVWDWNLTHMQLGSCGIHGCWPCIQNRPWLLYFRLITCNFRWLIIFPVAFQSKRQTACSRSTTEAEAIALATALFSDVQSLRKSSYLIKHPNSRQIVRATDAKEPFVTPQLGIRKNDLELWSGWPQNLDPPKDPKSQWIAR